jgi:uncharacterized radical SAM superfamily protein
VDIEKDGLSEVPRISDRRLEEKVVRAHQVSWRNLGRRVCFYAPGFVRYDNEYFRSSRSSFPSISVTGSFCSLGCGHCGGRILDTMVSARTPERLIEVCEGIRQKGAVGCLISGGCLPDGSVPIGRFVDAIGEVKERLGLTVVVHTGLVDLRTANRLRAAGVDAVSIDIIGSDETIREVYNLEASTKDYEESLSALRESGIPFTPHVLVGLHYGSLRGEMNALRMIADYEPSALILIAFFPIRGTRMQNVEPPSPETIVEVLVEARSVMPRVPIALGCARPKGQHRERMDALAVEAGVNGIAFPSLAGIKRAEALGPEISFSSLCCSLIYKDFKK